MVRKYKEADLQIILDLFYQTVHTVNRRDYTEKQLNVWSDGNPDMDAWTEKLDKHNTIVAVQGEVITGFADMDENGYLDHLYVHKDYQGKGIGGELCDYLETHCPVTHFSTHASISAKAFFENRGYDVVREQMVERKGVKLTNFVMKKVGIPTLITERLILRPLVPEDAAEAYRNWTSDPEVAKFMRWNTHQSSRETEEWILSEQKDMLRGRLFDWAIIRKDSGQLIGTGGLTRSQEIGVFELGYNLMKECWNKGYATEAAKKMVGFAVNELKQSKLYCCHADENPASGRVMQKAGFVYWKPGYYKSIDGKREFASSQYLLITKEGRGVTL